MGDKKPPGIPDVFWQLMQKMKENPDDPATDHPLDDALREIEAKVGALHGKGDPAERGAETGRIVT